jgi:hypothetical protein
MNAELIHMQLEQKQRLLRLNKMAIRQLSVLTEKVIRLVNNKLPSESNDE